MLNEKKFADVATIMLENIGKMQCCYTPENKVPQLLLNTDFLEDLTRNEPIDEELSGITEEVADSIDYLDALSCFDRVNVIKRKGAKGNELILINFLTNEKLTFLNGVLSDYTDFTTGEKLECFKDNYQALFNNYSLNIGDTKTESEYPELPPIRSVISSSSQQNIFELNKNVVNFQKVLTGYSNEMKKISFLFILLSIYLMF